MDKFFYLTIMLLFVNNILCAQEQGEPLLAGFVEQTEHSSEWVPSLLNASKNALYNSVIFNGRNVGWHLRGENNVITVLDGIQYSSPLNKWRFGDLLAGLQGQFQNTDMAINGSFTDDGYRQQPNVNFLSSFSKLENKNIRFSTSISNVVFANSMSTRINTPNLVNHWRNIFGIALQHMPVQLTSASYKEEIGLVLGIEKQFNKKNIFGVTFVWNYTDQSKVATTTKEVYDLAKQRSYNPTWGWFHLSPYFPNTKQSNAPIITFCYQHFKSENNYFKFSQSVIIGRQSTSSLEWTQTSDPRPDYYKYLPSYQLDSSLKNYLSNWYLIHPESLQINFDKIEQINKSSKDHRSYYMVNQQNSDLFLWNGALFYNKYYGNELNVSWGSNYLYHHIYYSNEAKDLLGGNYYYNYNNWVNDDGLNISFQNDVLHPDRKITKAENWGPSYSMNAVQCNPWIQVNKKYARFETIFGLGLGIQTISRNGFNMNGLFPLSSFGRSRFNWSTSKDIKYQVLYKFSGRIYIRSIAFTQWKFPSTENLFIDPTFNAITSPFVKSIYNNGVDVSIFYRTPNVKLYASAYWNKVYNYSVSKMFYHDQYASFVYGLTGDINKANTGLEFSAEMSIFQKVQLVFVSTLQKNIFLNNPTFQILSINDLRPLENGQLYIEGLVSETSPSFTSTFTLQYQPVSSLRFGITVLFAKQRPVALDYFRRSEAVKNKLDVYSWNKIQKSGFLPDNNVVNTFLSKSIQIKIGSKVISGFTSLSVRNTLNSYIPVFAYEQTRFDYVKFNANKYAVKYYLDNGITYTLRFQIQLQ